MKKTATHRTSPINRQNKSLGVTQAAKEEQRNHDLSALEQIKKVEKKYKSKMMKVRLEKSILVGTENYLRYVLEERGFSQEQIEQIIKDGHQ